MKKIGETIAHLRKNLNMSQRDFERIKQSTIANIEIHNRLPRVDTFLELISELHVNLDEFMFILNDYAYDERTALFKDIRGIRHSLYAKENTELKKRLDYYIKSNPRDLFVQDLKIILESYIKISDSDTYEIDSPESFAIYDRIEDQKYWTYEQIYIMSKLFYIFPEKRALELVQRIDLEFKKYDSYENTQSSRIAFLLNAGGYRISKHLYNEALPLVEEARDLSSENDNLVMMSFANAEIAKIKYYNRDKSTAQALIDNAITILSLSDKQKLADDIERTWEKYVDSFD
ncbi:helix-turn-helix transcriptional regulator [Listeria booriae]|uniref:helix-turn-helix domain-containing protein n=1 Tax=Listeria booriae TaxID=1552123 RepID=UPI001625D865|nr:helix-turn-helix transcriptional regulator [Listeria booriae]MBC1893109.1 helix-turn-helix transcriptional regulator [Listeria booriae]MBC1974514.1 helix-turn-helix transcriptional regulator [Listeria booriae]MBC2031805.1 helix-turn-helix transcriptional regulator [Listeria booriae]